MLDETVVRINGQQFCPFTAVDPETNRILYCGIIPTTTTAFPERFLRELREKRTSPTACVSSITPNVPQRRCGNAVERVFGEKTRRTSPFGDSFSNVDLGTAETW